MVGALTVVMLIAAGCGDSDATDEGTGDGDCAEVETLIEPSSIHVLPGAEVTYSYSPPASGPHQIPGPEPGVYAEALSEPLQVGAVEEGTVIVQYQPSVSLSDVERLEALAGESAVIVMPGGRAFDDEAAVAFTAWGRRQLCDSVDLDAAAAFVERFAGVVFVNHE